jgi:DNA replication protein DnaC
MNSAKTIEKLIQLHLSHMADAYKAQLKNPDIINLGFDERLSMMVDSEIDQRRTKKINKLIQSSKMKETASLENIDYTVPRGLNKSQILTMGECGWIVNGHNIIISGATGTGKTYLACAFGTRACELGYSVMYYRMPRFLNDLELARKDMTIIKMLQQLKRMNVLIIDDFAITRLNVSESRNLLEVIDDRNKQYSCIFVSQLPTDKWYETFEDPTFADAIMDRIIYNSIKIELHGPSMRKVRNSI